MFVLLLVVFLTIFISAQCSFYEATLYSTRMGTLEAAKSRERTKRAALRMVELKKEISKPIAAILILNTIANTAGATLAGMYAHEALGGGRVPLFSALFTLGILFFAEIIPKTVGAVYWRSLWPFTVWPLAMMKSSLLPVIFLTEKLMTFITKGKTTPPITEEDILGVVRLGAKEGEISGWESVMVHNIINLENKQVRAIMTPRTVMFTLNANMPVTKALEKANERGFSRIPIYRGDRENIIGYVMTHDMGSAKVLKEPETTLAAIAKPIEFVPATTNCLTLLQTSLKKRRHIAIVIDEYGGLEGLVTLEDLLEVILGAEIVDERDTVIDLQELARKGRKKQPEK